MRYLNVDSNRFAGQVPPWPGELPPLLLFLDGKQFPGEMPAELRELGQLRLGGNDLAGCLPGALHEVAEDGQGRLGRPDC